MIPLDTLPLTGRWAGLTAQAHIDTPLGGALLVASERGLAGLWFDGQAHHPLTELSAQAHQALVRGAPGAPGSRLPGDPAGAPIDDTAAPSALGTPPGPLRFDLPEQPAHPVLAAAIVQLGAYWRGTIAGFDLPLDPRGTAFQQAVWQQLRAIPCGSTATYGAIAARAGSAGAVRAVGAAVGRNPVSVIVPCHRVLGADGSLTGYAGGLDRKRALLRLEAGVAA